MSLDFDTLHHLIVGRRENGGLGLLAASGGLSAQDALMWQGLVALDAVPRDAGDMHAVSLFVGPNAHGILSRAFYADEESQYPIYHHVLLPPSAVKMLAGNMAALTALIEQTAPDIPPDGALEPLKVPPAPTWTNDKRLLLFDRLIAQYGSMETLFSLLGATLHERRLLVRGLPLDLNARMNLIQGIFLLLPSPARPEVTFTTYVEDVPENRAMIALSDAPAPDSPRLVMDAANGIYPPPDVLEIPYIRSLREIWTGDLKAFVNDLRAMELMAARFMHEQTLTIGLTRVAARVHLDKMVATGADDIPPDAIKEACRQFEPTGDLQMRYAENLLWLAMNERDAEAVALLADWMARYENVALFTMSALENALADEPDAVYFFARVMLGIAEEDAGGERWLPLLHSAAAISMSIVLQETNDAETVMTWIKLIANEPPRYQLHGILRDGITATIPLTHHDGELGRRLMTFTARRVSDIAPNLLADEGLIAAMEPPVGAALRDYQPEAVAEVLEIGREIALFMMERALNDAPHNKAAADAFAPEQIDYLWNLYLYETFDGLPSAVQPNTLINRLIQEGRGWLAAPSIETLIRHVIFLDSVELFVQVALSLPPADDLPRLLVIVFVQEGLTGESVNEATNRLIEAEALTSQQALDILLSVIEAHKWQGDFCLRLAEQVARLLQQNAALTISFPYTQKLLKLAEATRSDLIAKTAVRRAMVHLETVADDAEQITLLSKTAKTIAWSATTQNQLAAWWRVYARSQSVARLQAWDKALVSKKPLQWARAVVQTALSIRRLMNKRSLEEFADAISTAYGVLQAFSDSFDDRQTAQFDQQTIRQELDARGAELTPDERNILAKNLRELAELITEIAERRSKATLIRREEEIERQLLSGAQSPQSAIDTMRWLSGYLGGQQDNN